MIKLMGVSFQQVVFKECKLLGMDFSPCSEMLFHVRFEQCALDHSVLAGRRMPKTHFQKCSMKGVDLSGADLSEAVLDHCDLQDAVFDRTDLRNADLTSALHMHLDPDNNRIKGARFSVHGALDLLSKYGIEVE